MRTLLCAAFFILLTGSLNAQVQLGRIEFQKKDRQAIVLHTQYAQEIVEGAIQQRMNELGNKGKENKSLINLNKSNFFAFKGAQLPNAHRDVDLYFKTERRGGKNKDESTVYLVIGKGPDEFATTDSDPELMEKGKELMQKLIPYLDEYKLSVDIANQQDLVNKLNGKINNLLSDSTDLDKKIKGLQEKMTQNGAEREKQKAELEKQQQALEALKARRKQ